MVIEQTLCGLYLRGDVLKSLNSNDAMILRIQQYFIAPLLSTMFIYNQLGL